MKDMLNYRLGVGLVILNNQSEIFTGRRLDNTRAWQMPQGGIDSGEVPLEAAFREMYEETGIEKEKVVFLKQSKGWFRYDLPNDLQAKFWGGKFRGQSQKWFLFRFVGLDKDVNIASTSPEFSEWRWSKDSEMLEKIVPFKKELYRSVLQEFDIGHIKF